MIPEALQKASDKELRNILTEDKFRAKYFYSPISSPRKIKKIYEATAIKGARVLVNVEDDKDYIVVRTKDLDGIKVKPLTLDKLKEEKGAYNFLLNSDMQTIYRVISGIAAVFFNRDRFAIVKGNGREFSLIIHFPEIKITNTTGLELDLRDIFFKINFVGAAIIGVYITRTTLYDTEVAVGYLHSHVGPSSQCGRWAGRICFGYTSYRTVYEKMCTEPLIHLTLPKFLAGLENFLSWESIEGSPHIHMSRVLEVNSYRYSSKAIVESYDQAYYYKLLLQSIDEAITVIGYDYPLKGSIHRICLRRNMVEFLHVAMTNKLLEIGHTEHIFIYIEGASYNSDPKYALNNYIERHNNKDSEVVFKGKRIKCKVDKMRDNPVVENRLHIDIFTKVMSKFEQSFEKFIINKKLSNN